MSKIIRRTVGTKKEIGAALVLAQTGNSVEFFWQKPNLFRKLRPGVSVVGSKHGNPMQIGPVIDGAPSRHEPELTALRLSPQNINAQVARKRGSNRKWSGTRGHLGNQA